ncbi:UNVERIFIED_CONTAM: hypothetical protein FKN15_077407 [Acipenser sinensis]
MGRAASVADGETELIRGKDAQGQQVDGSVEAEGGEEAGSSTEGVAARAAAEETDGFDGNWRNQGGDRTDRLKKKRMEILKSQGKRGQGKEVEE